MPVSVQASPGSIDASPHDANIALRTVPGVTPPTSAAAAHATPPSAHGLGSLLRLQGLRRLIRVRLLVAFGDGAFQGALAGAVLFDPSQRSSPTEIAAGFAVLLLPYSLVGPFAGALLDRWSRRQVLIWANLARAAVIAGLAVLLAFGTPLWVQFVVALVVTGSGRFIGSGMSASLPHVVAVDSLVGANSLASTVGSIATLIGASYALGLRSLVGTGSGPTAIATASVLLFYLAAAAAVSRFSRAALGPDETDEPPQPIRAVLQGFTAGLKHAIARRTVGVNILMVMVVRCCVGISTLVVVLLFQHYFTRHHGIFRAGLPGVLEVLGVAGAGLFLGAVATAPMVAWLGRTRYLVILLTFSAAVVLTVATQFTQLGTMVTALVLAFTYQSSKICADTVVQSDCDDAHIGRVFALYDTLTNVFYVGGFELGAALVPFNGRSRLLVVVVAVVCLLAAAGYGVGMRVLCPRVATPRTVAPSS